MSVGDLVLQRDFGPVTRTDLVRYAGAGGDFNPIHHDETFARAAGYPSVFAHGLYTAGLAGAALAEAIGPLALRRFAVRYVGQVWPGDTLTVTVRETDAGTASGRTFDVTVEAAADGRDRRVAITGTAETQP
ncbi:MaoC/PaaZ C-terminal domain-containing protein [Microbacterium sp. zg-Y818]|uniref:MaoC/PaaZ C-terminal domain-containing protein n=1 Tax=unclassified Microbacterium TaxID=2609290 RepID=UPI00214B6B37|nr:MULTISPECIES: MaoC/PaaZ C-terminal domain-containing protein [unclassified Microbacterium]MCR2799329.1 MaoC/PaaZ C-terminal domain-containing protein [Microbacterium sp. zg.Y818]WIM21330.1 MaoC/PaaZ C-terminal domain-containing protein [Microbacterium sp. zg-Y818]